MNMTLSQLRAFEALAQEGHFGRAAAGLGISQPTLSKEVRRLERNIGVALFVRSPAGTTLTPEGERLRAHVAAVLERLRRLEDAASQFGAASRLRVRIAASPSVVNRLLPELLRTIDDADTGLEVQVLEVDTGEVLRTVEGGRADIGIGHLLGEPTAARKRGLGGDELRVLLHRSLMPRAAADLGRLANVPLLLWPRENSPDYYDLIIGACRSRGLEPLVLSGTSRIGGSWSYFLKDARAFALVPADFAAREALSPLVSLPLEPPATIPLEVVWRRHPAAAGVLEPLLALRAAEGGALRPARR